MNNDLISREALKKEVENLVVGGAEGLKDYYENGSKSDENSWIGGVYDAWELIDNAPTVEPDNELELIKRAVMIICRSVRPDGDLAYLDWEDSCKMQEIYHKLAKGGEEE